MVNNEILYGKAFDEFMKYYDSLPIHDTTFDATTFHPKNPMLYHLNISSKDLDERTLLNLIVDWFDSVGIFIHPKRRNDSLKDYIFDEWYVIVTNIQGMHINNFIHDRSKIDDRYEITKVGIKRACEYYNLKK